MTTKVICPRCGQDYLQRVELVALKRRAVLCPECEALWLNENDVRAPTVGSYGVTWFDFETFMNESGRTSPWSEGEMRIIEPFPG